MSLRFADDNSSIGLNPSGLGLGCDDDAAFFFVEDLLLRVLFDDLASSLSSSEALVALFRTVRFFFGVSGERRAIFSFEAASAARIGLLLAEVTDAASSIGSTLAALMFASRCERCRLSVPGGSGDVSETLERLSFEDAFNILLEAEPALVNRPCSSEDVSRFGVVGVPSASESNS